MLRRCGEQRFASGSGRLLKRLLLLGVLFCAIAGAVEAKTEYREVNRRDSAGHSIAYTLDNAGHRTKEEVKDPGGVLARQLTRVYDALGRVQQTTGRE